MGSVKTPGQDSLSPDSRQGAPLACPAESTGRSGLGDQPLAEKWVQGRQSGYLRSHKPGCPQALTFKEEKPKRDTRGTLHVGGWRCRS